MPVETDLKSALYTKIDTLKPAELDALPHGAIQLDSNGTVLQFNKYESQLAHLEKKNVIGKNFFKDVAPCTDVKEFHGRFQKGVAAKQLHEKFRYHFAFKQNPRDVSVTLFYSDVTKTVWVFVNPLNEPSK
jgi:photoactive yellow protein